MSTDAPGPTRIQEILLKEGLVDEAALAKAMEVQARDGGSLGRILADLGLASEDVVSGAVARVLGLEHLDMASAPLPVGAEGNLPPEFCRKRVVLPLGVQGRALRLAMADPLDQGTLQDVEFRTEKWVKPVVATESGILQALKRMYPDVEDGALTYDLLSSVRPEAEVEADLGEEAEVVDLARLTKDVKLPPIVRLVNVILSDAVKAGASDIHIEPQEQHVQVRQRVDGLLQDVLKIPKNLQQAVVSRLKIISGMDIAERRKPQDGRSRLKGEKGRIDLRVSTLPTHLGEKVVIRLLDSAGARVEMAQLGLAPDLLKQFQHLLTRPQGMILVTGPTGSGKTSTLYASLNWLKSPTKNIITVEDPIEYQIAGISQVQINTKAGVTFASGLRSILRQDPNVVLVGEIRDRETADIALEAAQTGHMLLSTLHTNSAVAAITRLMDLGIEPFMVAASLTGIVAQRLVRRVCSACAAEREPSPAALERLGARFRTPEGAAWKGGRGCKECRESGYRGRLAIHELLAVTDEVREQISRRAAEHQIRETAGRAGMRTLMEDGIAKAAQGLTTLEEVLRVAPPDEPGQGRTRAAQGPPARAAAERSPAEVERAVEIAADGRKSRVLVVEDSPTVATVVKYFLELEGFEVLVAEDGLAGLEVAKKEIPEVVVSDLNMPGMDGLSMVQALRQDPATRGAAILMLTSEGSLESETRGLEVGADDYLVKPVEPRRLAARVKAVLQRARGKREAGA